MKPVPFFTTLALIILAMIVLAACANKSSRTSTEYSVLRDLTDSTSVMPDEAALLADLGIDTDIWNGVNFNFFNVSDVSYTPHWRISLAKGGDRLTSSEYTRKREVIAFKKKLTALLDSARSDTEGRNHSSIYLPMAEELTRLAGSNAERKVLIVYSDLMENRQRLSFYDTRTFSLLRADPKKIEQLLFAEAALPDLSGIEIRFVYAPKDAADDANFRLVSDFFRSMFEKQGATVSVSANLIQ